MKKTILQKIREFEDSFNLSKQNEEYINKSIFRAAVLIALILAGITIYTNGGSLERAYVSCPNTSLTACMNPLWMCQYENTSIDDVQNQYFHLEKLIQNFNGTKEEKNRITQTLDTPIYEPGCLQEPVNKKHAEICDQGGCKKFLQPGETFGEEPNYLGRNITDLYILLFFMAFIVNHLWHTYQKNREEKNG